MSHQQFYETVQMEEQYLQDMQERIKQLLVEIWLPHPKYPSYLYSNLGRVSKMVKGERVFLEGTKCGRGYRAITFCMDGGNKHREYIHRTICTMFHGPQPDGYECRHLDGSISNNAASNLAWGTPTQNQQDKFLHGTDGCGERNPMAVLTAEKVLAMRQIREESKLPYYKIAREFGISTMTAFRAITKRAWL